MPYVPCKHGTVLLFQSLRPHRPGVYPVDYSGLPRVTTRAEPELKINITRGIFIWVKQTKKMITLNCLTRGNLWANATGYFSATDLTRDVAKTPGKAA